MDKTTELLNAIILGDSTAIQDTFNQAMLSRIADRLDSVRQTVAQGMFTENTIPYGDSTTSGSDRTHTIDTE